MSKLPELKRSEWLSPKDVNEIFGIPEKTLTNWRCSKIGPPYVKVGAAVRYPNDQFKAWLERNYHKTAS